MKLLSKGSEQGKALLELQRRCALYPELVEALEVAKTNLCAYLNTIEMRARSPQSTLNSDDAVRANAAFALACEVLAKCREVAR